MQHPFENRTYELVLNSTKNNLMFTGL